MRERKRYAGPELSHLLSLQLTWSAEDIVAALEHAMRYDAYEARFRPRSLEGQLADSTRTQIREAMREHPVRQRSLSDYSALRSGDHPTCAIPAEAPPEEAAADAHLDTASEQAL